MTDWKTTLIGVITAIASVLAHFNIILSADLQIVIVTIGVFLIGLFAKDAKPAVLTGSKLLLFLLIPTALVVGTIGMQGCSTVSGVEKVVCPYVDEIAQAAQLVCSLSGDSTASAQSLALAREQLSTSTGVLLLQSGQTQATKVKAEEARLKLKVEPKK